MLVFDIKLLCIFLLKTVGFIIDQFGGLGNYQKHFLNEKIYDKF